MIVVDIETTGTNPLKNSIVSIGAIDFDNPKNAFYEECCIPDDSEVEPVALEINGFSEKQIRDPTKKSVDVIVGEFLIWSDKIQTKILSGHNIHFDRNFLWFTIQKYPYLQWIFEYRLVDLHSICYADYQKRGIKLPERLTFDKIMYYVGLPAENKPHKALNGAKLCAEAFSRLFYKKNLLKEFEKFRLPEF